MSNYIPIPPQQRWRDIRMRAVPVVIFAVACLTTVFMWKDYVASPTMVGQAEPVQANVSCYMPGTLTELSITRFQKVHAGEPMGRILVTDPKILASSLAVIQADIEMLRISLKPMIPDEKMAMTTDRLHLDWMDSRSKLAVAKVNLQLAIGERKRTEELFKAKIVSQQVMEQAQATQDRYQVEVNELGKLVESEEHSAGFTLAMRTNSIAKAVDDPLRAAIAVQDAKLRLTESQLSPITLLAPVDGTVSMLFHRTGEAVLAGEPIATIAVADSVRIVSYLRPPIVTEPKLGMTVEVRTRGLHREMGKAAIVGIGDQMEPVAPALLPSVKLATIELGLPVSVSMPQNLRIRPGELVDLAIVPQ